MEERKVKSHVIPIIFSIIIISGFFFVGYYMIGSSNESSLTNPEIIMKMNQEGQNYSVKVGYINEQDTYNVSKWLDINNVGYLVPNCPVGGDKYLEELYYNLTDSRNLISGKMRGIVGNLNHNITYFDNDFNNMISVNDTIIIKGNLAENITESLNEYGWLRFYIVFDANYDENVINLWRNLGYAEISI